MVNDIPNDHEYQPNSVTKAQARELVDVADARRFAETVMEIEKNEIAKQAFGDAFVDILRNASGLSRSYSAAAQLALFFELVARGAPVRY